MVNDGQIPFFFPLKKFQISCLSSKLNVSKEQVWVRWGISCQPPKNTNCDATSRQRGGKTAKVEHQKKTSTFFQLKYGMRQFWESLQCKGDRAGSDNNFVVQKGLILRKKQLKIPIQWSCWPLINIFFQLACYHLEIRAICPVNEKYMS